MSRWSVTFNEKGETKVNLKKVLLKKSVSRNGHFLHKVTLFQWPMKSKLASLINSEWSSFRWKAQMDRKIYVLLFLSEAQQLFSHKSSKISDFSSQKLIQILCYKNKHGNKQIWLNFAVYAIATPNHERDSQNKRCFCRWENLSIGKCDLELTQLIIVKHRSSSSSSFHLHQNIII